MTTLQIRRERLFQDPFAITRLPASHSKSYPQDSATVFFGNALIGRYYRRWYPFHGRDGSLRRPRRVQRRNRWVNQCAAATTSSARCCAGGDIAARCAYDANLSYRQEHGQKRRFFQESCALCDPFRVKPVWRMSPRVAAWRPYPRYDLATVQVAKNRRLGRCGKQIARFVKHAPPRSGHSNEASRH